MILPARSLIFYSTPMKSSTTSMKSSTTSMKSSTTPLKGGLDILSGLNNLSEFPFDESLNVKTLSHVDNLRLHLRQKGCFVGFLVG
jgi:hypothetical protein